jgi:methionine-rich copper-binding protein CopC
MFLNMTSKITGLVGAFFAVVLTISQAEAHATLVRAEPAANSEVASPKVIKLHFSEAYEPKFSSFKLTDTDGAPVAITPFDAKDPKAMAATPAATLPAGLYTVSWTTIGDDTHKRTGSFSFTVK